MVKGMKSFVEQFREFPDCYTVIGGAACSVAPLKQATKFVHVEIG